MNGLGTRRDLQEASVGWSTAPGPVLHKWPTGDEDGRGFVSLVAGDDRCCAVTLGQTGTAMGLLALDGTDGHERIDLGHVVHSAYPDDDLDREALRALVDYVFRIQGGASIVTRNAPDHAEQLAPLRSVGLRATDSAQPGESASTRAERERKRAQGHELAPGR